jgi:hypothetical protein
MPDASTRTSPATSFDNINRYYFMLMAYPLKSHIQPFVGLGWGIQTLSNLQVGGTFVDLDEQYANEQQAEELASTAYMQFVAGVEIRVGILNVFGSLSAATGANDFDLIQGSVYTGQAGARISLGKSAGRRDQPCVPPSPPDLLETGAPIRCPSPSQHRRVLLGPAGAALDEPERPVHRHRDADPRGGHRRRQCLPPVDLDQRPAHGALIKRPGHSEGLCEPSGPGGEDPVWGTPAAPAHGR